MLFCFAFWPSLSDYIPVSLIIQKIIWLQLTFKNVGSKINPAPNFYPVPFDHQCPWKGTLLLEIGSDGGSFSSQKIWDYTDHPLRWHVSSGCNGKDTDFRKGEEEGKRQSQTTGLITPLQRQWGLPACARDHEEPAGGNMAVVRGWTELSPSKRLGSFWTMCFALFQPFQKMKRAGATKHISKKALGEEGAATGTLFLVPKQTCF